MISGGLSFRQMAVALLFIALTATACLMPVQADSYWHLRLGEDIWRTGRVPLVDSYSYTVAGQPAPNHEWLWQALFYLPFKAGGLPLLVFTCAVTVVATCALIFRLMVGHTATRFALMVAGVPLIAGVWAVRPQVATLLLLVILLWLLVHQRHVWIPPLFVVWANVHGAVALGGWILVAVTVAAAFGPRRRFLILAAVTALAALATAATPLGFGIWHLVGATVAVARQTGIDEWRPSYPTTVAEVAFWLLAIPFLILAARRWRETAAWPDRVLVVGALALFPLAVMSVRNIAPFLLVAMPAASRLLGSAFHWPRHLDHRLDPGRDHPGLNLALVVVVALALAGGVGVAWAQPHPRLGFRPIRAEAVSAITRCPGNVFNRYNEGGYLIWFVREKPVFVDSRVFPYPLEILTFGCTGEGTDAALEAELFPRFGITCAALPPDSHAARHLIASGWQRRYADDQWLVLGR